MPISNDLLLVVGTDLEYVNSSNPRKCRILPESDPAEGFVFIRWNPAVGETLATGKRGRVSRNFVQSVCAALQVGDVVHADTLLNAGGNGRSVLEAALASTPNCWVQRVNRRKCLAYDPITAHPLGQISFR